MANYRVFYPIHAVQVGNIGAASGTSVKGLQSVNMTTTFNLDQVFELGQLDIYANIENLPNVEMTLEKVLDGTPLIYHLATAAGGGDSLLTRSNQRTDIRLCIYPDTQVSASGTPLVSVYCSGMYVNNVSYSLPTQGNCTESVSFVGNDKVWRSNAGPNTGFDNTDNANDGDGIQRRQNVKMGTGNSKWPLAIPGIDGSGYNVETNGQFAAHISDVNISVNLGRNDMFELGRRRPYYRYANYPVAVSCTINVIACGTEPGDMVDALSDSTNLVDEEIVVKLDDGTVFNLGNKNKLQSVGYSGGDTGGSAVTLSYSYQNFNKLDVTSPA